MLGEVLTLVRPLILFDFETTRDTKAGKDRAVSLAFQRFLPDGTVDTYRSLIRPPCPISPESSEIHGITDAFLDIACARCWARAEDHPTESCPAFKVAPRFAQIAAQLYVGFETNVDFAGQHVEYDLGVLVTEFSEVGIKFDYSNAHLIDTLKVEQTLEPRNLGALYKKYTGQDLDGAHDALIDVYATRTVLHAQLTQHPLGATLPRTVPELAKTIWNKPERQPEWLDADGRLIWINGQVCFNFGEYKGLPLVKQPRYVSWMAYKAQKFSPAVKQICKDILAGKGPVPPTLASASETPDDTLF